jgi:ubiquitin carboxyl-terminal hydrolase 34
MCCFKEFKNFERMNNLTQVVLHQAIKLIGSLVPKVEAEVIPKDADESKRETSESKKEAEVAKDEAVNDAESKEKEEEEGEKSPPPKEEAEEPHDCEEEGEEESWTIEEKDCLFHMVTKIFMLNLPLYLSYKHYMLANLEELSQQEFSALSNYCELSVSSPTSTRLCYNEIFSGS